VSHHTQHAHDQDHDHDHAHGHGAHGHSHGLVDPSIVRSRAGVKAVAISLTVLVVAALVQVVIFVLSNSVALLADLIHNFGDASTAIPLGIAFYIRSFRAEKIAGLFVVATIFVSACVALYETIQRFIHPQQLTHLWALVAAGLVGFFGNEVAAYIRYRAGKRLTSPALIADGNHARVDGFVSLGVVVSAALVALGYPRADPIVGLAITLVILKITWDSWRTVSTTERGELPGSRQAANVLDRPTQPCEIDPLGLKNACDQTDRGSVVVHLALAEVACHAGGRGFESRRSRFGEPPYAGAVALTARQWRRGGVPRSALSGLPPVRAGALPLVLHLSAGSPAAAAARYRR
jgi:Co/Zn/Cd efflux system component